MASTPGDAGMNLLTCGPTSEWSNISYMLLKAIGNAKKRVWVQTPYFLPTESLLVEGVAGCGSVEGRREGDDAAA